MSIYFLDSSALAKRYMPETGTHWILQLCSTSAKNEIIIAQITPIEITSALARLYHEGKFKLSILQSFRGVLTAHVLQQYQVLALSNDIVARALDLHETYQLRAYDSVQLASALVIASRLFSKGLTLSFIAADVRLLQAATTEGLITDNPNNYP